MIARSNKSNKRLLIDDIKPFLGNWKKQGGELVGSCPVCADPKHLYVSEKGGKLLCFCHKCNSPGGEIIKAFLAMGAVPTGELLGDEPKELIEDYNHKYHNPDGTVAYYKNRKKWSDGSKEFRFGYMVDGNKVFKKPENCNNLYNLHLMQQALEEGQDTVYIVEGEKCADAMVAAGLLATTANTGAQKKLKLSNVDKAILGAFSNRIVIPDNDERGLEYATAWEGAQIINLAEIWPDCPRKGDVADYFKAGFPADAIRNYKFSAPVELNREYFDSLDSYQLIDDATLSEIFKVKEPHQRQKLLAIAEMRAQALKCTQLFKKQWKSYCMEQSTKNIVSENMTEFPGQAFKIRSGEWVCKDKVIRWVRKGDVERAEVASPIPIMPVEILVNAEDDSERLRLAYYKNGMWKSITVLRSTVASTHKIIELADIGIEVNSDNSKLLVKYIADTVALNIDILPRTKSLSHMGWFENDFVPYTDDIRLDIEMQYQQLVKSVSQKGTLEEWVEYIKPLRKNIYLRMIMAVAFASPLIEKVGALPFVLHLWGGTGTGKTVGLMVAASVWGNPKLGHMVRTMNTTINAMMSTASVLYNIPFFADELQTIKSKYENYDSLIMRITEGIDRGRMNNSAVLQKQTSWKNAFVFTGEEPCTQGSSGGGAKNRVIEVECEGIVVEKGNEVVNFINEHYGCAGKAFIEALGRVNLTKEYKDMYEFVIKNTATTDKQAMAMTLIILGDALASDLFFPGEESITLGQIRQFVKSTSEVDTAMRAFETLLSLINENSDKFHTDFQDARGVSWGKFDKDGSILINRMVLERELRAQGFEFAAVKKKWLEANLLKPNSQGRFYHFTSVNGAKAYYVKIFPAELEEKVES